MSRLSLSTTVCCFLLIVSSQLLSAPFDSGFMLLTQPNGVTFNARHWGDEFFSWFQTDGGYQICQRLDGWYCYAELDAEGEFTPGSLRVGVDSAPATSYHLDRSCIGPN